MDRRRLVQLRVLVQPLAAECVHGAPRTRAHHGWSRCSRARVRSRAACVLAALCIVTLLCCIFFRFILTNALTTLESKICFIMQSNALGPMHARAHGT